MGELIDQMGQLSADGRGTTGKQLVTSPEPPPLLQLADDEMLVFEYICARLREAGIEHITAGMPIVMVVKKFKRWVEAYQECDTKGRTQESKNGWHSPTPWADEERSLSIELGQWLPKICMTIPSLVRVRKDTGAATGQDDLFADLVQHATSAPKHSLPN